MILASVRSSIACLHCLGCLLCLFILSLGAWDVLCHQQSWMASCAALMPMALGALTLGTALTASIDPLDTFSESLFCASLWSTISFSWFLIHIMMWEPFSQEFYGILKDEYDSMDGMLLLGNAGHTCISFSSLTPWDAQSVPNRHSSLLCSEEGGARGRWPSTLRLRNWRPSSTEGPSSFGTLYALVKNTTLCEPLRRTFWDLPFVPVQVLSDFRTSRQQRIIVYRVRGSRYESLALEKACDSQSQGNIRRFSIERRPLQASLFLHLDYQVALQALEQWVAKSMSIVWGLIQRTQMW